MNMLTFEMNTRNYPSRCQEFRGRNNVDYYDGDLIPLSRDAIDMRIEKSVAGDYPIYRLSSSAAIGFRRSWQHIRADKSNWTVFWFVRRGKVVVSRSGSDSAIQAGEFTLTRSSKPFYMELTPDQDGELDVLHLVVPSHLVHPIISDNLDAGTPFSAIDGEVALAKRILWMLFDNAQDIDAEVSSALIETVLKGIGKTVDRAVGHLNVRQSIIDVRFNEIITYINKNISNPDLNAAMVARGCGISSRYFCYVMKKNNTSFSSYVWSLRLDTSKAWLEDENMLHYPISEIAYLSGYKSSAHFSRSFKSRFHISPRECRLLRDVAI